MKLSFWTIIIMAISVATGILAFAILHQYLPTVAAAKNYNDYRVLLQTEADKKPMAKRRVDRAKRAVRVEEARWNEYVAARTPEPGVEHGGISLAVNPYQLTVDTQKFRNSIQRAVDVQVKKGGVIVEQGPTVRGLANNDEASAALADYYNYPAIKFPVVIFDLGTVQVTGSYAQIMANVRSYKSMPHYLAVTDGLRIEGTSPHLTGTYSLTIVGFIRGKDIFPASVAPAGAASAAGAGAFPGGPGSFPGGPGSFPGGPPSLSRGAGGGR